MTRDDIFWLAGLFEGEGCISHHARARTVYVSIQMTDRDVLEKVTEAAGMGRVNGPYSTKGKDQWCWQLGARKEVARFLLAVYPLLGSRRRARVESVLERLRRPDARYSPLVHGTRGGLQKERKLGTVPCRSCLQADRDYQNARYRARTYTSV